MGQARWLCSAPEGAPGVPGVPRARPCRQLPACSKQTAKDLQLVGLPSARLSPKGRGLRIDHIPGCRRPARRALVLHRRSTANARQGARRSRRITRPRSSNCATSLTAPARGPLRRPIDRAPRWSSRLPLFLFPVSCRWTLGRVLHRPERMAQRCAARREPSAFYAWGEGAVRATRAWLRSHSTRGWASRSRMRRGARCAPSGGSSRAVTGQSRPPALAHLQVCELRRRQCQRAWAPVLRAWANVTARQHRGPAARQFSFFTFHAISYVRRRRVQAQRRRANGVCPAFALYILLFSAVDLRGPIIRWRDIASQLTGA